MTYQREAAEQLSRDLEAVTFNLSQEIKAQLAILEQKVTDKACEMEDDDDPEFMTWYNVGESLREAIDLVNHLPD